MAELGLHVSGSGGRLERPGLKCLILVHRPAFVLPTATHARGGAGGQDTPSDIQIFTREGRHIAGTSLTTSEISSLLTSDNGFVDGAVYSSTYLNKQAVMVMSA